MIEPARRRMTIRRMRFAYWITKAKDTHSEYVILIAFPRQLWLRERASVLRYTYIISLVPIFPPISIEVGFCIPVAGQRRIQFRRTNSTQRIILKLWKKIFKNQSLILCWLHMRPCCARPTVAIVVMGNHSSSFRNLAIF